MSKGRVAVIFGQFGIVADPVNLPHFNDRLKRLGFETILVQHMESQRVHDFLRGYNGFSAIVGASLGAGAAPVIAGYLRPQTVNFVGGFQPSNFDPVMHAIVLHGESPLDLITRAVDVQDNVHHALCFRNPILAATAGLGHATYVLAPGNRTTKLEVVERPDVHPGDFGPAQDAMVQRIVGLAK